MRKFWMACLAVLLACAGACLAGEARQPRTLYVNNVTGSDRFDGLRPDPAGDGVSGPFASIAKAFASVETSDRIEIANTGKPYAGGNTLVKAGGTATQPLVINGNGAVISGLGRVPKEKWSVVRQGIVATEFWPMSNLLKGYRPIQHWIGSPQIWWLDGRPAPNCTSEEELLRTEGGFYWNKPRRQVWVHLPAGKTLDDVEILIPVHGTCICINTDFVVVRDLRAIFSWNDGFDTHGTGKHIVFQRCIATDNCGQGFSVHDTNVALYEECLAERNASSGSCDVNECHSYYRRCVFVNNTFEAGVYGHDQSQHTYEDCLILGNTPFEQVWQRGFSRMNFINCVIRGNSERSTGLISAAHGALHFRECTLADAAYVCRLTDAETASLSITHSILARCKEPFLTLPNSKPRVILRDNIYHDGPGVQVGDRVFGPEAWEDYQKSTGLDTGSVWRDPGLGGVFALQLLPGSPVLALRGQRPPQRIGAVLPPSVWELYARTRNEVATPAGIVKRPAARSAVPAPLRMGSARGWEPHVVGLLGRST